MISRHTNTSEGYIRHIGIGSTHNTHIYVLGRVLCMCTANCIDFNARWAHTENQVNTVTLSFVHSVSHLVGQSINQFGCAISLSVLKYFYICVSIAFQLNRQAKRNCKYAYTYMQIQRYKIISDSTSSHTITFGICIA